MSPVHNTGQLTSCTYAHPVHHPGQLTSCTHAHPVHHTGQLTSCTYAHPVHHTGHLTSCTYAHPVHHTGQLTSCTYAHPVHHTGHLTSCTHAHPVHCTSNRSAHLMHIHVCTRERGMFSWYFLGQLTFGAKEIVAVLVNCKGEEREGVWHNTASHSSLDETQIHTHTSRHVCLHICKATLMPTWKCL